MAKFHLWTSGLRKLGAIDAEGNGCRRVKAFIGKSVRKLSQVWNEREMAFGGFETLILIEGNPFTAIGIATLVFLASVKDPISCSHHGSVHRFPSQTNPG